MGLEIYSPDESDAVVVIKPLNVDLAVRSS